MSVDNLYREVNPTGNEGLIDKSDVDVQVDSFGDELVDVVGLSIYFRRSKASCPRVGYETIDALVAYRLV